ncbi:hypothetical protein GA0070606_0823 [Micromonospora citrea]|uniref:Uncharacterized protein n=1 Tax=Micromonospora citrea TaxID=47855 RepID=A0A1C6TVF4_9ACTN|nr:hypothetical protein GA0070606_0823 [Micromonospora citrea]
MPTALQALAMRREGPAVGMRRRQTTLACAAMTRHPCRSSRTQVRV